MKIRRLGVFLGLLGLFSCSKEQVIPEPEPQEAEQIVIVGEDFEAVYSGLYQPQTGDFQTQNLTSSLGLPLDYLVQRNYQNDVSFFSFEAGAFSLFRQNMITGSSSSYPDFYINTTERSIIWGADQGQNIYLAYFTPLGSSNLSLLRMNVQGQIQEEMTIEFGVQEVYPPLLQGDYLLVGYRTGNGNYKIGVMQLGSFQFLGTLDLGTTGSPAYFITAANQLGVLLNSTGEPPSIEVYDLSSLEFLFADQVDLNQFFEPGPLQAELLENDLYYYFAYAQPSPVIDGPAQFSLDSQSNRLLDVTSLRQQLEAERGLQLVFTAKGIGQSIPPQFFLGYGFQTTDNTVEGGVVILDAQGNVLAQRSLPFIPTALISRGAN